MIPKTIELVIPDTDTTMRLGRVEQIKAIRILTGLGLKDSKDISDAPGKHTVEVRGVFDMYNDRTGTSDPQSNYIAALHALRATGVTVNDPSAIGAWLEEELRALTSRAVLQSQYELAADLIVLLQKYNG